MSEDDHRNTNAARSYTLGYGYTENSVPKTDRYNIRTLAEAAAAHPIGAQSWVYGYDQGDRLLSAAATAVPGSGAASYGTYSWGYDKLDNAKPITYPPSEFGGYTDNPTYNALNQQTKNAWWQNFTYDAAGNITREYNENNITQRQYSYDMEGRLLTMTTGTAGYEVRFFYDGLGRRILQKTTSAGATTYKRYLWCGQTLCQQRDTGTNPLRRYLATGEYVNALGGNPAKKYVYFTDHLGSVRDLMDATTGARVGALDYKPYGAVKASSGILPDFQYAGLLWVPEMGLNASSTRFYDPGTTRWMTADWIDEAGGVNRYAYVNGNPVMNIDPLGLRSEIKDGNIVITPEDASVPSVTIPLVLGANGVRQSDRFFHTYNVSTVGTGCSASAVERELVDAPTPNPADSPATPSGTSNNVGQVFFRASNYVNSFRVASNSPEQTDIIINYTIPGRHELTEGFVIRWGFVGSAGRITLRSYGEGNAAHQMQTMSWLWEPVVNKVWGGNQTGILERAGCSCEAK